MTIPTATYRLQFRNGMTFRRAIPLVSYLHRLGISHLYASPVFAATSGSTHGYDMIDPNRFDPRIGDAEDFDALSDALKAHGMGLILDIVPNHMAASLENDWWRSVLEHGRASAHAHVFDIDWSRRLTLPYLSTGFEEAARSGALKLVADAQRGSLAMSFSGLDIPLHPGSYALLFDGPDTGDDRLALLGQDYPDLGEEGFHDAMRALLGEADARKTIETRLEAAARDPALLTALHERQSWELMHWREAPKRLSYRRFFEVTELVGVNVEDEEVFEDTHRLILDLVRSGRVDGLRVDHVDGLSDPAAYLDRLRKAAGDDTYIVVEKILEDGENLPASWPVSGTTGYEFIDWLTHLLVDGRGAERLRRGYGAIGGAVDYHGGLRDARIMLIEENFEGEVSVLKRMAVQLALSHDKDQGATQADIERALQELLTEFPVYRTYGTSKSMPEADTALLSDLADRLGKSLSPGEAKGLGFLVEVLTNACPPRQSAKAALFRRRFQQLTGPLMAKALEDTLFYRQMPVLGLNEVGGNAGREEFLPRHFHEAMTARAKAWPLALSATATHDTKRGEDARARLLALTDEPQAWIDGVTRWRATNSRHVSRLKSGPAPEPELEWALYQALLGVWPPDLDPEDDDGIEALLERLHSYAEKAVREAKLRSRWTDVDTAYEAGVKDYLSALLAADNRMFLKDFHRTIQPYLRAGAWNGMIQTLVKLTAPGIPDIYQGAEKLDLSLVDPDNRRPPDFDALSGAILEEGEWPQDPDALLSGQLKQMLIARLLPLRQRHRDLLETGDYQPLNMRGAMKTHAVAFRRNLGKQSLTVIVPRLSQALIDAETGTIPASNWGDTAVDLPDDTGPLSDLLSGDSVEPQAHLRLSGLLTDRPFALLLSGADVP